MDSLRFVWHRCWGLVHANTRQLLLDASFSERLCREAFCFDSRLDLGLLLSRQSPLLSPGLGFLDERLVLGCQLLSDLSNALFGQSVPGSWMDDLGQGRLLGVAVCVDCTRSAHSVARPDTMPGMAVEWRYVGKKVGRIFAGVVFIYLAVALVLFIFQRKLIYASWLRDAPAVGGRGVDGLEKIWRELPGSEGKVEAWLLPGEGVSVERPGPLVVFTHGNAELIDDWTTSLDTYRRWGFNVLLPEYRGYGRSGGSPAQDDITDDLVWFLDRVSARPEVDGDTLILHGRSLGGGAACAIASERPPKVLILQSTFARLADLSGRFFMPSFLVLDEWDNEEVVATLDCPVLIMHGPGDEVVPFPHSQRLVKAARNSTFVSQDCRHADCPPDYAEHWKVVEAFLDKVGIERLSASTAMADSPAP